MSSFRVVNRRTRRLFQNELRMRRLRLLTIAFFLAFACSREGDEALIDREVDAMVEAAGDRDAGPILDRLSENYSDSRGNKKEELRGYLAGWLFRNKSLYALKLSHQVTLEPPDAAVSQLKVALAASKGVVPDERDAQRFDLRWAREADGWKIVSAEWRELRAGDLFDR
jgi:hypothetical protein